VGVNFFPCVKLFYTVESILYGPTFGVFRIDETPAGEGSGQPKILFGWADRWALSHVLISASCPTVSLYGCRHLRQGGQRWSLNYQTFCQLNEPKGKSTVWGK
jgi:hypothetical protein